jgi:hypothetical protein
MRAQGHAESTERQSAHSEEIKRLWETNMNLDRLRAKLEDKVAKTQKAWDQLCASSDALRAQITQLQSDHAQELESLRGRLQQGAVDPHRGLWNRMPLQRKPALSCLPKADLRNRLSNSRSNRTQTAG